jgi:hypothetical protein
MIRDIEGAGAALLVHMFLLEFNGFQPFTVASFEAPNSKFEVVEIDGGGQSITIKEAGGEKIEEFTVEFTCFADDPVLLKMESWRADVQTHDKKKYYRDGTVRLLGPNYDPVIIGDIEDAWPSEPIKTPKFDAKDKKEALKVTVKFQCNYFKWRQR